MALIDLNIKTIDSRVFRLTGVPVEDKGVLAVERASFEALLDSDDKREGIAAFREKRKPDWSGR